MPHSSVSSSIATNSVDNLGAAKADRFDARYFSSAGLEDDQSIVQQMCNKPSSRRQSPR
jgi:hypothetical protein